MKRWQILENKWNRKQAPWSDAVGIEEVDDDAVVPAIICWFTRGHEENLAEHVVRLHNAAQQDAEPNNG